VRGTVALGGKKIHTRLAMFSHGAQMFKRWFSQVQSWNQICPSFFILRFHLAKKDGKNRADG